MITSLIVPFVFRTSLSPRSSTVFFLHDPASPETHTLSLHDALPICFAERLHHFVERQQQPFRLQRSAGDRLAARALGRRAGGARGHDLARQFPPGGRHDRYPLACLSLTEDTDF